MFLILRLIRILMPAFKDFFEDKKEDREKARQDAQDAASSPAVFASSGDALQDSMSAYKRGDYRGAYEAAGLLKGSEGEFFQGAILLAEGRLNEAEPLIRKYLAGSPDAGGQANANALLGELLIERGNYDEAAGCLQTGMTLAPDLSAPFRQMAVVALRQGMEPDMALSFAREAVEKEKQAEVTTLEKAKLAELKAMVAEAEADAETQRAAESKKKFPWQKGASSTASAVADRGEAVVLPSSEFRNANMAESLAALAWALAASGEDEAEVDKLIHQALPLASGKGVSTRGEIHFHAACAYAELGVQVKSTKHFTQAASADPNGRWGKAAKNMLMAASRR